MGQLLEEGSKERLGRPFDKKMVSLLGIIVLDVGVGIVDKVYLGNKEKVDMLLVTQKQLYEDLILKTCSQDHAYSAKWVEKLDTVILWEGVCNTLYFSSWIMNAAKTAIWEQIHLNFYTQWS